ncbi:MAG: DUF2945 domain-containing protein [Rhodoferax sp.]|nr:DUF2945 domain-containing protein [Actinomycetota bacterium]
MSIRKGSKVTWNTEQGTTEGTVVERKTADFTLAGHQFRASDDQPMFVVESAKTGKHAAHHESALSPAG